MLSEILKKEDCAACRFCCAFRRQSLWETPIFSSENIDAIENNKRLDSSVLEKFLFDGNTYARYDLSNAYKTNDSEEEAPCPYLSDKGCILDATVYRRKKHGECPLNLPERNRGGKRLFPQSVTLAEMVSGHGF